MQSTALDPSHPPFLAQKYPHTWLSALHSTLISQLITAASPDLRNEFHNAPSLLDLPLRLLAEVACPNDERYLGDAALAQDLGVAERQ